MLKKETYFGDLLIPEIPPLLVLLPETRQNVGQDQAPDKQELPMRFDLSEA